MKQQLAESQAVISASNEEQRGIMDVFLRLVREEEEALQEIKDLTVKIEQNEATCKGLRDRLHHCEMALQVLDDLQTHS